MRCIGALDQGTQSTRFVVYDASDKAHRIVASHQVEFTQHQPKTGWYEHDALEIYASVLQCMAATATSLGGDSSVDIAAVGITNQRETLVAWDRLTGEPLCRAIVWLDVRSKPQCERLMTKLGGVDALRKVTGLPISTYASACKWMWMLENQQAVRDAHAEGRCQIGTVDTWLIYKLTGGANGGAFVTDVTNASRTNFFNLVSLSWDEAVLEEFDISKGMLAEVRSNAEVYGHIADGPLQGVPISGALGDQQAAMLGQRCRPLEAKNTYGTGCFVLLNTGGRPVPSQHGLISTIAYQLGPAAPAQYALEGSIANTGAGVRWLRDNLGIIATAPDSEALARSVPDAGGVHFVPAFNGLLAPHWRADARGAVLGLSNTTTKAHITRALLDAIAWQTRDVVEAMLADAGVSELKLLRVDGGASQNNLLMQLQADVLQIPVVRPANLETTSLGAAYAAGIGIGHWTADQILSGSTAAHGSTHFEPKAEKARIDRRYNLWHKAVWLTHDTDEFESESEDRFMEK